LRTHGRSEVTFSNDEEMKKNALQKQCNWQHVQKLQKFPSSLRNVTIRSKCKSAGNCVLHFHTNTWSCITQNSQLIKQPWGIQIVIKMLLYVFQVFCDHAAEISNSSHLDEDQNFLGWISFAFHHWCYRQRRSTAYHTTIIFRGTECIWRWARLQFLRRSTHSRNTGSVSCNSGACCAIFSQNEENAASDRKRWTALHVTSAHFLALVAVMSLHSVHCKVVLSWSANA